VGGFITESSLGWRWTSWMTLIMSAVCGVAGYKETSHQVILQTKAKKLQLETHNWALHSKLDEKKINLRTIFSVYLSRPLQMIFQEPILALITIYMAFIYGIIFLFFEAYPISFQKQRGWSNGVGALPFIAILLGIVTGSILIIVSTKTHFARSLAKNGRIVPEERLPLMMLGAVLLPIGLFWFAWTSSPRTSWIPQVLAGVPTGCGIFMIFLQGMNYIVDVYTINANSAIAANTMFRSLAGAAFLLFANYIYERLGVAWATSLLAFLCVLFLPVPFL
jgi:DHA1 family multidrug resistance protein-like MFS transporter